MVPPRLGASPRAPRPRGALADQRLPRRERQAHEHDAPVGAHARSRDDERPPAEPVRVTRIAARRARGVRVRARRFGLRKRARHRARQRLLVDAWGVVSTRGRGSNRSRIVLRERGILREPRERVRPEALAPRAPTPAGAGSSRAARGRRVVPRDEDGAAEDVPRLVHAPPTAVKLRPVRRPAPRLHELVREYGHDPERRARRRRGRAGDDAGVTRGTRGVGDAIRE